MTPRGMLDAAALALLATAVALPLYAYIGYPLALWVLGKLRGDPAVHHDPAEWPRVSIVLAVYNEVKQVREVLDALLQLDYPAHRRQIVVVSDASDDGTDGIVRSYADRGVEFVRLDERSGKTAAENAALAYIDGELVLNTDASVRVHQRALKPLVRALQDPTVGVATGRDVSVAPSGGAHDTGESRYVGYEMGVRSLENRVGGIVGASGCLYVIRRKLHEIPVPAHLSRDFASALTAREHGYRAVSVPSALCLVPRAGSLSREYRRKVRTFTRGIQTLAYKRHLMNPFNTGLFAWKLFSHKVCRWGVPVAAVAALVALAALSVDTLWARWLLGWSLMGTVMGSAGYWLDARGRPVGSFLRIPAFVLIGNLAALGAIFRAMGGKGMAVWEPTRRDVTSRSSVTPAPEGS